MIDLLRVGQLHSRILNIDVNDQLNPGRRVVFTLYAYNCRPGLGCSLTSIHKRLIYYLELIGGFPIDVESN